MFSVAVLRRPSPATPEGIGLNKLNCTVSVPSTSWGTSLMMGTRKVVEVWPLVKVNCPVTAVKSSPDSAVPLVAR